MAFIRKDGQGSLFVNERQNDRQPNFRGVIVINGIEYELAAWERTSQRGIKYLSLQASEYRQKAESTSSSVMEPISQPMVDNLASEEEDIPF